MLKKTIVLVVPIHNEDENLETLVRRIFSSIDNENLINLVLVDDGSTDESWKKMLELSKKHNKVIALRLSRNFGHQYAVLAGLEYARTLKSELIAIIDADLQDPPEVIGEMMTLISPEIDVVYGKRTHRDGERFLKKFTALLFYRFFNWMVPFEMPLDVGDFRVFKSELANTILASKDSSPFLRGLFAHAGFPSAPFLYSRQKRFSGKTKYNYRKMFGLALDATLGFSDKPFRVVMKYSIISLAVVTLITLFSLLNAVFNAAEPGWTSILGLISFFGTLNVLLLSLIGRYVTLGLATTVSRPRWIVREVSSSVLPPWT